jgi:uncharacterized protein with NAD-binding domain and iron-sulfur cluster
MTKRTQVTILGGGVGAIVAAYELSSTPELRERFEVTVYQLGWRLGGKGASGRNAAAGSRIEEHGLHLWLGFYANAFRTMRECYGAWGEVPFEQAFTAQRNVTLEERIAGATGPEWRPWVINFPPLPGMPGDDGPPGIVELLRTVFDWLIARWTDAGLDTSHPAGHAALRQARDLTARLDPDPSQHSPRDHRLLVGHLDVADGEIDDAASAGDASDTIRRLLILLDLGVAVGTGFVKDVLPKGNRGYDEINGTEFRAWLVSHGASETSVRSAPVGALYDLGFASIGGDDFDPLAASVAAGVALKILMHMVLGSRGAPLWKMHAGMGDTVFTPFYEVLKSRGVNFEFFHRVRALRVSASGGLVERVELERQVEFVDPAAPYEPLVNVKGLGCWPSEPDWSKIRDGPAIAGRLAASGLTLESPECHESAAPPRVLTVGRDFDVLVLGISLGALREPCAELVQASPAWALMLENVPTVSTIALQLWVTDDLASLGWTTGSTVLSAFAEPFDSWADMSHLRDVEDWPPEAGVRGVHYFCGAFDPSGVRRAPGGTFQQAATTEALRVAERWLNSEIAALWPKATTGGAFRWPLLVDLQQRSGVARLADQYVRANVDGSELYVLSTPNSIRYRLRPDESDFDNLFLAGDWTRTTFNAGCVEAAVESGLRAAQAIHGGRPSIFGDASF